MNDDNKTQGNMPGVSMPGDSGNSTPPSAPSTTGDMGGGANPAPMGDKPMGDAPTTPPAPETPGDTNPGTTGPQMPSANPMEEKKDGTGM